MFYKYGVLIGVFLGLLIFSSVGASQGFVYLVKVEGMINPGSADYILRALDKAQQDNANALIIQLNTPGGLVQSMDQIIGRIENSRVPVIVYVAPGGAHAFSAGTYILMASHIAAMAPATSIGACQPVEMTGTKTSNKTINAYASKMRSLAEDHERPINISEKFVTQNLALSPSEALEQRVIDFIAVDLSDLKAKAHDKEVKVFHEKIKLDLKGTSTNEILMSTKERFMQTIADPNVAYILFTIGFIGLIAELYSPGAILPGVLGGICIILALFAFGTIGVNITGILLIVLAIILFIADIKAPTHGILTAGGIAALVIGSLMLVPSPEQPFIQISWPVIVAVVGTTTAFFVFAIGKAILAHRRKPAIGPEEMIGMEAIAESNLKPEGTVMARGEYWKAYAEEGEILKGEKVVIVRTEGLKLFVRKKR
ncbi:MAG: nodulation protein NfeD [Euryarchaeota archaeon]|nr:nodulation protein NfeD [Euryarchaeota archaeon]